MAMNLIQFEMGRSLAESLAGYRTEQQCEGALERARWPDRLRCPRCCCELHCVVVRQARKL